MKKGFMALILSAIMITTTYASAYIPKPAANEQEGFQMLFIQSAEEVNVNRSATNPDLWTVTLKNVDPDIAYFSESPKKMAGKVSIENFIQEVGSNRSNASKANLVTQLSHSGSQGSSYDRQVILSNPRFDKSNNSITYDAKNPLGSQNLQEGNNKDPVLFIER